MDIRVVCINSNSQFVKVYYLMFWQRTSLIKTAWQSSTAGSHTGAERAVDGRYTDLSVSGGQCAESDYGQTAEWRVDLGGVKYIHHVFIQHTTDNDVWGIVSFKLINSFYLI